MSDPSLNYYIARGASSAMTTFVPTPATPAAGPLQGYLWYATDLSKEFAYDFAGATWVSLAGGGGGGGSINISAGTTSNNLTNVVFSNSNHVSFGLNGSTITASIATSLSNINVSAGTTSNNLSAITFSNSNGVSFGLNGSVLTATVATNYQSAGAYLTTAALSQDSSKYAGTNGAITGGSITVNTSGVSVNIAPQTNQTLGAYALGNTTGQSSSSTFDARTLSISGLGNVSVGYSGSNLIISGGTAAAAPINVSAGTTSGNLGSLVFSNSNGVSFGLNGSTITATVKTDYQSSGAYLTTADLSQNSSKYVQEWALTGNTSGTTSSAPGTRLWFSGGNSLTVSGNGNTIVISVGNYLTTAMQSNAATISNINVSAGTTSNNLSKITFSNSNGVSFGLNGSVVTASVAAAAGSLNLSAGTTSNNLTAVTFANSNGVSFGLNASTVTASVATSLTNVNISAGTTSNNLSALVFSNSNNVSFGLNGSTVTASISAPSSPVNISAGTTSNNLGSIVFADSNGISWGLNGSTVTGTVSTYSTVGTATTGKAVASANSVGTITRWAAEDHAHAGVAAIGISTAGNTAGTTGSEVGTYWLQGGNNVTLSQITSNNGSHTLIVSGPSDGTVSLWPYPLPASTTVSTYYSGSTSQGAGGGSTQTGYTFSLYANPLPLPGHLAFSELRLGVSNSRSTAGTGSVTQVYSIGLYTNNASTLSLVKGYYGGLFFTQNSITAQSWSVWTASTGSNSVGQGAFAGLQAASIYSSAGNISANSQMEPGLKWIRVDNGTATTLTEGQYYCVLGFASMSSGSNVYANVGILQSNAISTNPIPDLGRENSTQTSNYLPAWGAISTTYTSQSNAAAFFPLPTAIAISNLTMTNSSGERYHFPMMRNHS